MNLRLRHCLLGASTLPLLLSLACGADNTPHDAPDGSDLDAWADEDASDAPDGDTAPNADADTSPEVVEDGGVPVLESRGQVADTGDHLEWVTGPDTVSLRPRIHVDGAWVAPDTCTSPSVDVLTCDFTEGVVSLSAEGGIWALRFTGAEDLDEAVELGGVELSGDGVLSGAQARMSNGFQSWSQSGVVAIAGPLDDGAIERALAARGDAEVIRDGAGPSWFHSFAGGGEHALVAGVDGPSPFRTWIEFASEDDTFSARLAQGGGGEFVSVGAGEELQLGSWFIAQGPDLTGMLADYGDSVRVMEHDARPEQGWNSWYELWSSVDEEAVLANATIAREALGDTLSEVTFRVVIDDGWQNHWGDWFANEKFPRGLDGLANELEEDGFEVGVWLAPLLAAEGSDVFADHPEWFIPGVSWNHIVEGRMRVLDVTHPDAADHLQATIRRLVDEGMGLLKIDFLFAGTFAGQRTAPVTGMQAYDEAMRLIREAAGDDVVLLAVGAPGVPSFPYVQSWRIGPDIAVSQFDASWYFLPNQLRTIAARWMFCGRILCDGDPPLLRTLPRNEVEVGGWIAGLAAGALFLSDDLRVLDTERRSWLPTDAMHLATSLERSVPLDLIPADAPRRLVSGISDQISQRNAHVVPTQWRLPGGSTLLVNLSDDVTETEVGTVPARSALRVD